MPIAPGVFLFGGRVQGPDVGFRSQFVVLSCLSCECVAFFDDGNVFHGHAVLAIPLLAFAQSEASSTRFDVTKRIANFTDDDWYVFHFVSPFSNGACGHPVLPLANAELNAFVRTVS